MDESAWGVEGSRGVRKGHRGVSMGRGNYQDRKQPAPYPPELPDGTDSNP